MAIASIAHWEWPEHWPSLITDLIKCLNSGDQNLINGAIRCLGTFLQFVTICQVNNT